MACGRRQAAFAQFPAGGRRASHPAPLCGHAASRVLLRLFPFLIAFLLALPRAGWADPIKAEVTAGVNGGYARLVFSMSDYDVGSVRKEGNVLIISFGKPIDVSVDRLAAQAPNYIGAARRDPDGMAVRLALARQVSVNGMAAGEKYFVDLLPDTWRGPPPGLPQDVVEGLVRRARQAEQELQRERRIVALTSIPPVRVALAIQPTFSRFIFAVPRQVVVVPTHDKSGLTLSFDAPLKFDLGDVVGVLPSGVRAIKAQVQDISASIHFDLGPKIKVRTFRDENGYAVDIVGADGKPAASSLPAIQQALEGVANLPAAPLAPVPAPPPPSPAKPLAARVAPSVPGKALRPPPQSVAPSSPPAPRPQPAAASSPPPPAKPLAVRATPSVIASPPPPAPAVPPPPQAAASPPPLPVVKSAIPAVRLPAQPLRNAKSRELAARPAAPPAVKSAAVAQAANPPPQNNTAGGKIAAELARDQQNLKLSFDFMLPTAAAIFNRADTLWLVFDSKVDIDLSALQSEPSGTIRSAVLTRAPDADIVRIKLDRPHLLSVATEGPVWTVQIGDTVAAPTRALDLDPSLIGPSRASMVIPLQGPHALHRITDPEAGDQLLVVTAFAPARGVLSTQRFVEFRALATQQGVVVEPLADDVAVALAPDKVVISRPAGLMLSSSLQSLLHGTDLHPSMFDPRLWGLVRKGSYEKRQSQLIAAAAEAPANKRLQPRLALAGFYLARAMYPEAEGVLDVALGGERPESKSVTALVLRAVAEIMMGRPEEALKDLDNPAVGDQHEAALWRALAYARLGKWREARMSFKRVEGDIATLPMELQRFALKEEMRASIEVKDFGEAEKELNDLETIGIPAQLQPAISVLVGRLDQALGRDSEALVAYRIAAASSDQPAAAQGRLRETLLRYSLGDLKRNEVVSDLESLTTVWRGDETEIEALRVLARLYTEEGRYRDSFYVMRSAMAAHPGWDMTRKIQEEAAKTFDSLFLAGKGDSLSAIDALALFYDFRELTPIGSRGDEMIRRLADRLVSVDLLDQAAGLLQYQVDKRLQGAARAEVATRLAVIYLMNRKADKALATLRATHTADLPNELRDQRLLLEARALSDLGRRDVAIEVIADVKGSVATRLRSDIYWAAQKWRQSAEQIELLYGNRWKQWQPLTDVEQSDVLRAALGYALAEDKLDLDRFRDRYGPKMAGTPDAKAFAIATAPLASGGKDFKLLAHEAAAADTLDDFLRDMKARYPQSNPVWTDPTSDIASAGPSPLPAATPLVLDVAPEPTAPPQTRLVPSAAAPGPSDALD